MLQMQTPASLKNFAANAAPIGNAPQKSMIDLALHRSESATSGLMGRVIELRERLQSVLSNGPTAVACGDGPHEVSPGTPSLAIRIDDNTDELRKITQVVDEILAAIEL